MTQRLDYNQIAPAARKPWAASTATSCTATFPLAGRPRLSADSQINNCAYCLDMHTRDLLKKGEKIEKLALLQAWAEGGISSTRANAPPLHGPKR